MMGYARNEGMGKNRNILAALTHPTEPYVSGTEATCSLNAGRDEIAAY